MEHSKDQQTKLESKRDTALLTLHQANQNYLTAQEPDDKDYHLKFTDKTLKIEKKLKQCDEVLLKVV